MRVVIAAAAGLLLLAPAHSLAQNAAKRINNRLMNQNPDDPFNTDTSSPLDQMGANPYEEQDGQEQQDTVKKEKRIKKPLESYFFGDSVRALPNFRWHITPGVNRVEVLPLDTALQNWRIDYPYMQRGVGDVYLGNLGAATVPLNYAERPESFDFGLADPFRAYLYTVENVNFYNVKHPFTHATYITAGQKRYLEENFQITHAQNISPTTGVNVDYKSRGTRGIYSWQRSRAKDLSVAFSHTGRRYSVHAGYIYNSIDLRENGGVVGDWAVVDTVFELPSNVPMKLNDARNRIRNNTFYAVQSYGIPLALLTEEDFSMADLPAVYVGHAIEYSRWNRKYTDTRAGTLYTDERDESGGQTAYEFYRDWFINPEMSNDSTFESRLSNRFFVQVQPYSRGGAVGLIDGGFGIDNHRYYQFSLDDYLTGRRRTVKRTSYYVYGAVEGKIRRYVDWGGDVKFYPSGYRGGDLEVGARLSLSAFIKGRPITLQGRFTNVLRSPNHWQENYFSNHYAWFTPLKKENETRFEATLDAPDYALEVGGYLSMARDKIYMDAECRIAQAASTVNVTGLYAHKDFRFGGFHLDNRVLLQWSTDQKVIPVPTLSLFLSYYFEFNVVKNVLRMQVGLDGRYNTKYYSFGYNPALARFYNQREKKVGGYPMVDAFVSAKWKRMRILVKLQHANYDLIGSRNYFSALDYPLNTRVLKLGFSWGFYD